MLEISKLNIKFGYQIIWYLNWQYYILNDEPLKVMSYGLNNMSYDITLLCHITHYLYQKFNFHLISLVFLFYNYFLANFGQDILENYLEMFGIQNLIEYVKIWTIQNSFFSILLYHPRRILIVPTYNLKPNGLNHKSQFLSKH